MGGTVNLTFAQAWDGALEGHHLLFHSDKKFEAGNAGGIGEGFKFAANSLLRQFSSKRTTQRSPTGAEGADHGADACSIVMVMNGKTWKFSRKPYGGSVGSDTQQLVVDEVATKVKLRLSSVPRHLGFASTR